MIEPVIKYIEEPFLTFGCNQKAIDPRDGLMLFGPFDKTKLKRRVNQQVQNYNTRLKNSCFGVEKFNFSLGLSFNFFCIEIILLSV